MVLGLSGFFSELLEKGRQDTGLDSPGRIVLLRCGSGVRQHFLSPLPLPGLWSPGTCPLSSSTGHSPGTVATAPHASTSVLGHAGLAIVPLQPHPILHHKFSFRRPSLRRASRRASSVEPRPENWTVMPWGLNPTALGSEPDHFLASWPQSGCRCS